MTSGPNPDLPPVTPVAFEQTLAPLWRRARSGDEAAYRQALREVTLIVPCTGHVMAMVAILCARRSALLILACLAGKVLLHDLSDAGPVARILCLLVLGIALYGSGLVCQRKMAGGTDAGGR